MISGFPINTNNSNQNMYDEIQSKDVTNENKSFGLHVVTKNVRISIVLIKRVWKKREKMTNYVKKKTLGRKSKDRQKTISEADYVNNSVKYVKKLKTIKPEEFTGDRKWCWDEFERHIGIPKRLNINPALALAYLRAKRHQRLVPEAINLKKRKNPESVLLAWDKPVNRCSCPHRECFCRGDELINKKMKIPNELRPRWIQARYFPFFNRVLQEKVDTKTFLAELVDATGDSTARRTPSSKRVTLHQELCIARCKHYLISGDLQSIQYLPYFVMPSTKVVIKKEGDTETKLIEEVDDRVCNTFSCTVSTQTDTGPDGELNIGKFSHCLFSNVGETYLPDIRGKKLQITHYTHASSGGPDMQVCVRNMEKLLDVKEMKIRVSKFLSSIYEIKDPGPPVRTCATQVPWRRRVYDSFKIRAPNRCGDKDYDDIPEIPWSSKIHKSIFEETTKEEFEEDEDSDICPCCELFAGSDIDKETLLDDIINVLSLPRDVRMSRPDLSNWDDENITDVKIIVEEVVAKAFEELDKCCRSCCDRDRQKKNNTEVNNEKNESITNRPKIDTELEKKEITNENGNEKEGVDKNNRDTNEMITEEDNSILPISLSDTGTASKERSIKEISNVKKAVKCDFLRQKKTDPIASTKPIYQRNSKSVSSNKDDGVTDVEIDNSNTHIKNDSNQSKLESGEDISKTKKINHESKISSKIQHPSQDKIVLQVNTSYKKTSSAFSSLFKWIFDQKSILSSEMKKKSSMKTASKEIYRTDDTILDERDSKSSETEVFSMKYSSIVSANKKDIE